MVAKILIERKIKPDSLGDILDLYRHLRSLAMRQQGYISGETLVSADCDDEHLVISTWHSLSDWQAWENNPERLGIAQQIESLLDEPSTVRAFTTL
ncbi:antibiotic biosynthesis monooxygenase [Dehalococcoidia bacterium]|nr:antibiotic biosynthesis monooxygenase [Dehalococcoidia bacterium]MCL0082197.1 antibiotic biosynthesis monooxygenase [Dehalococcoidia bacterium]